MQILTIVEKFERRRNFLNSGGVKLLCLTMTYEAKASLCAAIFTRQIDFIGQNVTAQTSCSQDIKHVQTFQVPTSPTVYIALKLTTS